MNNPERLEYAWTRKASRIPLPAGVRVKRLGRIGKLSIFAVDGELLRREVDVDWTMGGNGARYAYVPMREIWIDKDMSPVDGTATLLHEMIEQQEMTTKACSYDKAHDVASEAEQAFRDEMAKWRTQPRKVDVGKVRRMMGTLRQ